MKTLTQLILVVAVILLLPFLLLLRLVGWRPAGQKTIQSLFPSKPEGFAIVSPEESDKQPYPYVQVNNDGSVRELHKTEQEYLETPFFGADGGRPYVKWRYNQKNGWESWAVFSREASCQSALRLPPLR